MSSAYQVPPTTALPQSQGLTVRPDVVLIAAILKVEDVEPEQAVALLQKGTNHVALKVHDAAAATVRPRRFVTRDATSKLKASSDEANASVELAVELALQESDDFWTRARHIDALQLALRSAANELGKLRPALVLTAGAAVAHVKDAERYRAPLVEAWVARARALAKAAETERAPLVLRELAPPGEIAQTPVGPDAVVLTLAMAGRIDVVEK